MDITDSCLDAETLAAWVDGGLSADALRQAETHVAGCQRCQALVATLVRIDTPAVQPSHDRVSRRWFAWLAPLTAAAAAVTIWVLIPRSQIDTHVAVPQAPASPSAKSTPAEPAPVPQQESLRRRDVGQALDRLKKQDSPAGAPADARAAAPSAAPADAFKDARAPSANALEAAPSAARREMTAAIEIASPDPMVRWRLAAGGVERSSNGGVSWETTPTGVTTGLLSGVAPSASVCWLVGRAGVVLLYADAGPWRRLPFPEMTDLSSVRARDARAASITTADGRVFSTSDAGATWSPGPLQGF